MTQPTRVAIVTGAGRGLGREHALELARLGMAVVVNDLGTSADGAGTDRTPAEEVAAQIMADGGSAVADVHDVSDWPGAEALVNGAIERFGRLDVLVNNAGILRDRTIAAMGVDEWDAVIRVHLRGTFAPSHFAAAHWRRLAKQTGEPTGARLINTTSGSGIYGNYGQANYGAAKAGIAAFTVIAAMELKSSGATANAVAPSALTRMTESLVKAAGVSVAGPEYVAKVVGWLASPNSAGVSGRVFDVTGSRIGVAEGWRLGPEAAKDSMWTFEDLDELLPQLVAKAAEPATMSGKPAAGDQSQP
jgi:NAD(P)-dependent dehydrogenase (short-subunit alcohol dehydrogenase family)